MFCTFFETLAICGLLLPQNTQLQSAFAQIIKNVLHFSRNTCHLRTTPALNQSSTVRNCPAHKKCSALSSEYLSSADYSCPKTVVYSPQLLDSEKMFCTFLGILVICGLLLPQNTQLQSAIARLTKNVPDFSRNTCHLRTTPAPEHPTTVRICSAHKNSLNRCISKNLQHSARVSGGFNLPKSHHFKASFYQTQRRRRSQRLRSVQL